MNVVVDTDVDDTSTMYADAYMRMYVDAVVDADVDRYV